MKPPDRFVEWLKEHPAVWEALTTEWFEVEGFGPGDWFYDEKDGEIHLVDEMGEWQVILLLGYDSAKWLPALGELVRMLQRLGYKVRMGPDHQGYVTAGAFEHKTELAETMRHKSESEWEIACTALWAKVNGVE